MGGVATPELAGAVAAAGGLGMLCEYDATPAAQRMTAVRSLAEGGSVGMGFFGQWIAADLPVFEEAAARLDVVEIFWSEPNSGLVTRAKAAGGALVTWQVGTADSAAAAADAGCDFVVVQGVEAGGHVRATTPRDRLLDETLARVDVPVVVAGAVTTATQVAELIGRGAAAVRVGTRFVTTAESGAHPAYIDALIGAQSADETVLTTAFGEGWPDAPHRVLRSAVAAAEVLQGPVVGHEVVDGQRRPITRFSASPPTRATEGDIAAMALYAGAGVGEVRVVQPAADVVADLVSALD
jgi:NAD(P)H-dependent flavin oxidoreductase YrpB (nitropropane dioxygenase family)